MSNKIILKDLGIVLEKKQKVFYPINDIGFCFARPEKICIKECSDYSECPKYLDKFCMEGMN